MGEYLPFWHRRPFARQQASQEEGGISEKLFVKINNLKQGMFIKGKKASNPVLLYLHGGMPDYFLTRRYHIGLEDLFTVVWWEQRGSGLSYSKNIPRESMSLKQMMSDTLELTNYLRHKFGQEKIYLMGHSGGTFIGIQAAASNPELYNAYIGVAQMINQLKSETLAYQYMLERFREKRNQKMVRRLEAAPVSMEMGTPDGYVAIRDKAMHSLGIGTAHDMESVITGLFLPSLACGDYSLLERINLWRGKKTSGISSLWSEMLSTDLNQKELSFKIPIYFFEGIYDYTCSYFLAKDYFGKIEAPIKGFYTFYQSAHSPIFEEPERAQKILLQDVLGGVSTLSD